MSEYTEELESEFEVLYWHAVREAINGNWTMKNGEKIHVTEMSDSHIKNCIAMLERNWSPFADPFINMFKREQERRTYEETIHQYHERHKEVLKEMSMPVGRNVMDALKKRESMRLIDMDLAISKCVEDMEAVKDLPQRLDGIRDAVMNIYECPTIDAVSRQKYEEDMESAFAHGYTDAESNFRKMIADGELVEVVRCKDCKYYVYGEDEEQYYCRQTGIGTEEDFYCASGERKNDE